MFSTRYRSSLDLSVDCDSSFPPSPLVSPSPNSFQVEPIEIPASGNFAEIILSPASAAVPDAEPATRQRPIVRPSASEADNQTREPPTVDVNARPDSASSAASSASASAAASPLSRRLSTLSSMVKSTMQRIRAKKAEAETAAMDAEEEDDDNVSGAISHPSPTRRPRAVRNLWREGMLKVASIHTFQAPVHRKKFGSFAQMMEQIQEINDEHSQRFRDPSDSSRSESGHAVPSAIRRNEQGKWICNGEFREAANYQFYKIFLNPIKMGLKMLEFNLRTDGGEVWLYASPAAQTLNPNKSSHTWAFAASGKSKSMFLDARANFHSGWLYLGLVASDVNTAFQMRIENSIVLPSKIGSANVLESSNQAINEGEADPRGDEAIRFSAADTSIRQGLMAKLTALRSSKAAYEKFQSRIAEIFELRTEREASRPPEFNYLRFNRRHTRLPRSTDAADAIRLEERAVQDVLNANLQKSRENKLKSIQIEKNKKEQEVKELERIEKSQAEMEEKLLREAGNEMREEVEEEKERKEQELQRARQERAREEAGSRSGDSSSSSDSDSDAAFEFEDLQLASAPTSPRPAEQAAQPPLSPSGLQQLKSPVPMLPFHLAVPVPSGRSPSESFARRSQLRQFIDQSSKLTARVLNLSDSTRYPAPNEQTNRLIRTKQIFQRTTQARKEQKNREISPRVYETKQLSPRGKSSPPSPVAKKASEESKRSTSKPLSPAFRRPRVSTVAARVDTGKCDPPALPLSPQVPLNFEISASLRRSSNAIVDYLSLYSTDSYWRSQFDFSSFPSDAEPLTKLCIVIEWAEKHLAQEVDRCQRTKHQTIDQVLEQTIRKLENSNGVEMAIEEEKSHWKQLASDHPVTEALLHIPILQQFQSQIAWTAEQEAKFNEAEATLVRMARFQDELQMLKNQLKEENQRLKSIRNEAYIAIQRIKQVETESKTERSKEERRYSTANNSPIARQRERSANLELVQQLEGAETVRRADPDAVVTRRILPAIGAPKLLGDGNGSATPASARREADTSNSTRSQDPAPASTAVPASLPPLLRLVSVDSSRSRDSSSASAPLSLQAEIAEIQSARLAVERSDVRVRSKIRAAAPTNRVLQSIQEAKGAGSTLIREREKARQMVEQQRFERQIDLAKRKLQYKELIMDLEADHSERIKHAAMRSAEPAIKRQLKLKLLRENSGVEAFRTPGEIMPAINFHSKETRIQVPINQIKGGN